MSSKRTGLQRAIEIASDRDLEALLAELYVDRRHTDAEIAAYFSALAETRIPRSTVQTWRDQMGISREDRPPVELSA